MAGTVPLPISAGHGEGHSDPVGFCGSVYSDHFASNWLINPRGQWWDANQYFDLEDTLSRPNLNHEDTAYWGASRDTQYVKLKEDELNDWTESDLSDISTSFYNPLALGSYDENTAVSPAQSETSSRRSPSPPLPPLCSPYMICVPGGDGGNVKSGSARRRNDRIQERESYPCAYCVATFVNKRDFVRHTQKHMKSYPCTSCSQKFGNSSDRKRHVREMHEERRELQSANTCPAGACERHRDGFARRWNLIEHIRRRHPGEYPHYLPRGSKVVSVDAGVGGNSLSRLEAASEAIETEPAAIVRGEAH